MPSTQNEWEAVAQRFENRWNFPHCIGALDGKHIVIQKPGMSGSTYLNYKHTFSIVLMAVVDSEYRFMYVSVGAQGRMSDACVFNSCRFFRSLQQSQLALPPPEFLPGTDIKLPYMVVADDAFPLTTNIMKPFSRQSTDISQRIFNYRLSRARRVVENAFGILAGRFRVFRAPITLKVSTTRSIVLACVCLHNFLLEGQMRNAYSSDDENDLDFDIATNSCELPKAFTSLPCKRGRVNTEGKLIRKALASYFTGEGAVQWQWNAVNIDRPLDSQYFTN